MQAICVIPARAGSKRIKNKNIYEFEGKPMLAHTISAALASEKFKKVYVATDSEEIASIAKKYGAEVPFLRTNDADDFTPISEATLNFCQRLELDFNEEFDVVCQAMANCPLRDSSEFINAMSKYQETNHRSIISGFRYGMFNPWWARRKREDGDFELVFPEIVNQRSQDLDELVCPSGAIWVSSKHNLKTEKTFYSKGYQFYIMDWYKSVDIDDFRDLELARFAFKWINS